MVDQLRDFITTGKATAAQRGAFKQRLIWPWFRPPATRLDAPWIPQSRQVEPGVTLIVTASRANEGALLWRLEPRPRGRPHPDAKSFSADAEQSMARATFAAVGTVPIIGLGALFDIDKVWMATPIGCDDERIPGAIDGRSASLAGCLATASLLMGCAVPSHLMATAEVVTASDALVAVEGVHAKARRIAESALGVTTLLVHPDNVSEARRGAEAGGRPGGSAGGLEVVPVGTVEQALRLAFPDVFAAPGGSLTAESAARIGDRLFELAVTARIELPRWAAAAGWARTVAAALAPPPPGAHAISPRRRAEIAGQIFARHANEPGLSALERPTDDELAAIPSRSIRHQLIAQVLQSAADCADGDARGAYAWANARLPGPEESDPAITKARGAAARVLSAVGDFEDAESALAACVDEWRAHAELAKASFSISELLRVRGVLAWRGAPGAAARVEDGAQLARELDRPDVDASAPSRGFVRCAAARSLLQAGRFEDAATFLEDHDLDWALTGKDPNEQRTRWLARIEAALGHADRAAALRAKDVGADTQALMALDAAIERGEDGAPELDAARQVPELAGEVARVEARHEAIRASLPRAFAEEYRY